MANRDDNRGPEVDVPKVDRRGTSILVPLGISIVFIVLAALMLVRDSEDAPPVPTPDGGAITQPSTGNK